jgi:hypothetical protein
LRVTGKQGRYVIQTKWQKATWRGSSLKRFPRASVDLTRSPRSTAAIASIRAAGFNVHLIKPVSIEQLRDAIAEVSQKN